MGGDSLDPTVARSARGSIPSWDDVERLLRRQRRQGLPVGTKSSWKSEHPQVGPSAAIYSPSRQDCGPTACWRSGRFRKGKKEPAAT